MNKRTRTITNQMRELQDCGYQVDQKRAVNLHTNPKDETIAHAHAKTAVAQVLAKAGYAVDSEVEHEPTANIADVIGFGLEDRHPVVVELESDWWEDLPRQNVEKYLHGPVREVYTLDVSKIPRQIHAMHEHIQTELGL